MGKYQEVLAELIEQSGVSGMWLSKQMGVHRETVYSVLHGRRGLTADKFVAWCKALGATVTVEWKNPGDEREKKKWVL